MKKLGIILAFMHSPKILILDEATSGLDPIMQQTFYELLKEEKERGTTIFYSTHILSEISKICDRVGIIKEGKLLKIESIEEIKKRNLNLITVESNNVKEIIETLKIKPIFEDKNKVQFKNTIDMNTLIKSLSNYKIDNLLIEEATLEDLLLHYYK